MREGVIGVGGGVIGVCGVDDFGGSDDGRIVLAFGRKNSSACVADVLDSHLHLRGTHHANVRNIVEDSPVRTVGALSQLINKVGLRRGTNTY